jgi:hypothetical protein
MQPIKNLSWRKRPRLRRLSYTLLYPTLCRDNNGIILDITLQHTSTRSYTRTAQRMREKNMFFCCCCQRGMSVIDSLNSCCCFNVLLVLLACTPPVSVWEEDEDDVHTSPTPNCAKRKYYASIRTRCEGERRKKDAPHRSQGAVRAQLDAAFAVCRQSITEVPTVQLGEYAHHLLKIRFCRLDAAEDASTRRGNRLQGDLK